MDDFSATQDAFDQSLARARNLCDIQRFIDRQYSPILDTSDLLRASVVLSVSAFDFLIHEIFRIEVIFRFRNNKSVEKLIIPFDTLIANPSDVADLISEYVSGVNSYKSFVDPGKYAEAMVCFVPHPWNSISALMGGDSQTLKGRLRAIHKWRNRIAHEADIKPILAGVELWPIQIGDVLDAVGYIARLGVASIELLRNART